MACSSTNVFVSASSWRGWEGHPPSRSQACWLVDWFCWLWFKVCWLPSRPVAGGTHGARICTLYSYRLLVLTHQAGHPVLQSSLSPDPDFPLGIGYRCSAEVPHSLLLSGTLSTVAFSSRAISPSQAPGLLLSPPPPVSSSSCLLLRLRRRCWRPARLRLKCSGRAAGQCPLRATGTQDLVITAPEVFRWWRASQVVGGAQRGPRAL